MRYCPKCGVIYSSTGYKSRNETLCDCNIPYKEDGMDGKVFDNLLENEKEEYAQKLFKLIKSEPDYDETIDKDYYKEFPYARYAQWWREKCKELGGSDIDILTREEADMYMQNLYEKRDKKWTEEQRIKEELHLQQSNIPKCPTCQSTNLTKISSVGKVAKVGLFGIFGAGDLGKTWKCKNCGSKW